MVTKAQLIDYGTLAIAIIGIILMFRELVTGMLPVQYAAAGSTFFVVVSQIGSIIAKILEMNGVPVDNIQKLE